MRRFWIGLAVVAAVLVAACVASLAIGAVPIKAGDVLRAVADPSSVEPMTATIVRSIRAPRVVAACVVGWALALSGLCFQSLLKNPLASEYTLGVASGASLGAVAVSLLGFASPFAAPMGAFAGSLVTIVLVSFLAHASLSFETNATILAGIIFTALANAVLSLVLTMVSPNQLQTFFFWFMGSLASSEWPTVLPVAGAVGVLSVILLGFGWSMNAIAVNEELATQVGVPVMRTKSILYLVASLLTALVVSIAGTIGFIGLVVPHLARVVVGTDNRKLIPVVALSGAALCVLSDLLARTMLAPNELPVGVVTAFIGVPVFVSLMRRRRS